MTISSTVQSQFFQQDHHQQQLIRLPLTMYPQSSLSPSGSPSSSNRSEGLTTAATAAAKSRAAATNTKRNGKPWTPEEHNRFLEALESFPSGPWKLISAHVATRTTRQTMTHAQKYREKIARHSRAQGPDAGLLGRGRGRGSDVPCKARARKHRSPAATQEHASGGDDDEKDECSLGDEDAVKAEDKKMVMMEVVLKEEEDLVHQLEERSVRAAIAALLDEYEPFDVLNDNARSAFCLGRGL